MSTVGALDARERTLRYDSGTFSSLLPTDAMEKAYIVEQMNTYFRYVETADHRAGAQEKFPKRVERSGTDRSKPSPPDVWPNNATQLLKQWTVQPFSAVLVEPLCSSALVQLPHTRLSSIQSDQRVFDRFKPAVAPFEESDQSPPAVMQIRRQRLFSDHTLGDRTLPTVAINSSCQGLRSIVHGNIENRKSYGPMEWRSDSMCNGCRQALPLLRCPPSNYVRCQEVSIHRRRIPLETFAPSAKTVERRRCESAPSEPLRPPLELVSSNLEEPITETADASNAVDQIAATVCEGSKEPNLHDEAHHSPHKETTPNDPLCEAVPPMCRTKRRSRKTKTTPSKGDGPVEEMNDAADFWYVKNGEDVEGPYTDEEIKKAIVCASKTMFSMYGKRPQGPFLHFGNFGGKLFASYDLSQPTVAEPLTTAANVLSVSSRYGFDLGDEVARLKGYARDFSSSVFRSSTVFGQPSLTIADQPKAVDLGSVEEKKPSKDAIS